jgi:hypothetical protein
MAITFFFAVIGWIIFRANSMSQAIDYICCMFTNPFFGDKIFRAWVVYGSLLMFVEWLQRDKQHALQLPNIKPFIYRPIRWCIYILLMFIIDKYFVADGQTFIYFQF